MICPTLTPFAPSRLLGWGAALVFGLLMFGLLASGPSWAQVTPPQTSRVMAAPGQSAADIALDHVPAGISFEQFLLALYLQNPQALNAGSLQVLPNGTALMLPTAAQAGAVAPDQARAQLLALRRPTTPPTASPAEPVAANPQASQSPAPQEAASQAGMGDASAASPAPVANIPAASPAGASATGLPVDPLLIIFGGGALLVALLLVFRRPNPAAPARPAGQTGARERQAPADARPQTDQTASVQAQERLRPSLPLHTDQRRPGHIAPPAAPEAPAAVSPASPPAGPSRLSEFGALPSLDLGAAPAPAPAPMEPAKPLTAQAGAPAPAAPAPGPLNLSGISLDLHQQPPPRP
jgi:pilus assembly protein FimV